MPMHFHRLLLISFLLGFVPPKSMAVDTLRIEQDFVRRDLLPYAELFVDSTSKLGLEQLLQDEYSSLFSTPFESSYLSRFPEAYWLRIRVLPTSTDRKFYILSKIPDSLERLTTNLDRLDLFVVGSERQILSHEKSGYYVPKSEKSLESHAVISVVPLNLPREKPVDLYVRFQNFHSPQSISLGIELRDMLLPIPQPDYQHSWAVLSSLGMLIIIACYVWVFYFYVRDKAFLYFGVFCLLYGLDFLNIEPYGGISFLIPEHPTWAPTLFNLHFFCLPALLRFGRYFIDIKKHYPTWDKGYLALEIYMTLAALYYVVRSFFLPYLPIPTGIMVGIMLITCVCMGLFLKNNKSARIFAVGFVLFLLCNLLGIWVVYQGNRWGSILWAGGQFALLLLFAIALGNRLLSQERIKAEVDKIRELDQLKTRFFANISHEFRTPLSLILGPLQGIDKTMQEPANAEAEQSIPIPLNQVHLMKRNAKRLEQLVNQILDLSKIESRKMNLNLQEGMVLAFIRSRVAEFVDVAYSKNIHFLSRFGEEHGPSYFDKDKLEKILVNLLSNSLKFTQPQEEIRVEAHLDSGKLYLTIKDSGQGMNAEEVSQIFNRFYQADHANMQGSGIGMALVKELVDLHKGQIHVESQAGKGTEISIRISVQKEDYPGNISAEESDPGENTSPILEYVDSANKHNNKVDDTADKPMILVVEDNRDLQQFMEDVLSPEYRVILASDGVEGFELAKRYVPDLIISDVMMPRLGGFELVEQLVVEEKTCHIPVILLTAKSEESDTLKGLELGAVDYVTKPFHTEELSSKVKNQLLLRENWEKNFRQQKPFLTKETYQSMDEQFLQKVRKQIIQNLSNEDYSVENLAEDVDYSRSQLFRKLKALTGRSPLELIRKQRLNHAKDLIEARAMSISEVAYQVGYSNLSYFSQSFKKEFGVQPSELSR